MKSVRNPGVSISFEVECHNRPNACSLGSEKNNPTSDLLENRNPFLMPLYSLEIGMWLKIPVGALGPCPWRVTETTSADSLLYHKLHPEMTKGVVASLSAAVPSRTFPCSYTVVCPLYGAPPAPQPLYACRVVWPLCRDYFSFIPFIRIEG